MAKIFSQAQMDEIYEYFKNKMNSLECVRVVPEDLIPYAMTGSNTPQGIAGTNWSEGGHPAWHAFKKDGTSFWGGTNGNSGGYLEYEFPNNVTPTKVEFNPLTWKTNATIVYKIQLYDNDNNEWVDGCENQTIYTSSDVIYSGEYSVRASVELTNFLFTNKIRITYVSTNYMNAANAGNVYIYGYKIPYSNN